MAAVYKALHVRFKEPRALKVINPELANDANFVRRFEQEAVVTRKLQHPNAVRVDDIDEAEDGRPFIVMEFVEGDSLKNVIEREAPMPAARVCSIIKQVAAALDAAHRLGLVHRDIKPANIALLGSGDRSDPSGQRVKVLDFGIAKLKEAHLEDSRVHHETLTGTGMVIGTPAYMSPEQAKGLKGEQLDGRSDLYSLGVVAYQMLTGDLPLKADSTLELLMAHVSTSPKPVHEVRPELKIPASLAAVVMRCLEKNRQLRPASGRVLIDEIEFAAGRESGVPFPSIVMTKKQIAPRRHAELVAEPTVARRSGALRSRSRSWLGVVAAILIAGALGGGLYWRGRKLPAVQDGPRVASDDAKAKPVVTPTSEPAAPATTQQPPTAMPVTPPSARSQGRAHSRQGSETPKPLEPPSTAVAAKSPPAYVDDPALGSKPPVSVPEKSSPPASVPAPAVGLSSPVPTSPAADLYIHTDPVVDLDVYVWVYLDNDHKDTIRHSDGRLQISGLPLGQHRLRLEIPKYEHYEETVDLAAGLNVESVTLVPAWSGGPKAAATPESGAEGGITFEVLHDHTVHLANGRLRLSGGIIGFHEYGPDARPKDDFSFACSEIKEVKSVSFLTAMNHAWFHIRTRSRNYNFALGPNFHSGDNPAAIVAAIRAACGQR